MIPVVDDMSVLVDIGVDREGIENCHDGISQTSNSWKINPPRVQEPSNSDFACVFDGLALAIAKASTF
jgi:hypothetical protein